MRFATCVVLSYFKYRSYSVSSEAASYFECKDYSVFIKQPSFNYVFSTQCKAESFSSYQNTLIPPLPSAPPTQIISCLLVFPRTLSPRADKETNATARATHEHTARHTGASERQYRAFQSRREAPVTDAWFYKDKVATRRALYLCAPRAAPRAAQGAYSNVLYPFFLAMRWKASSERPLRRTKPQMAIVSVSPVIMPASLTRATSICTDAW
eukprot:IDg11079t1